MSRFLSWSGFVVVACVLTTGAQAKKRRRGPKRQEIPATVEDKFVVTAKGKWLLNRDVTVLPGGELAIEPGAFIDCEEDRLIEVQGRLVAGEDSGEDDKSKSRSKRIRWIQFRMRGRGKARWVGITVEAKGKVAPSLLRYCKFSGAARAVLVTEGKVTIDSCVFSNNDVGVELGRSGGPKATATITNCRIAKNKKHGIKVVGQDPKIDRCSIESNRGAGIHISFASRPTISGCDITKNRQGGVVSSSEEAELGKYDTQVRMAKSNVHSNRPVDLANRTKGKWICTECYLGPLASRMLDVSGEVNLKNVEDNMDNNVCGEVQLKPHTKVQYKVSEVGSGQKIR